MKVSVIGTGYVGLVAGACLAELGNEVICLDIDQKKIDQLNNGVIPIYEPGLKEIVDRNVREKRLVFTTDTAQAVKHGQAIFIAVGTPSKEDGSVDLKYVKSVAEAIGQHMDAYKVIVDKSTVPVGTQRTVTKIIKENQKQAVDFDVVSNPEFLREGEAIKDFTNPDRVVIGIDGSQKARQIMTDLYKGIARADKPIIFTSVESAEMIKYASNAMLATRISFMNEVARLCEKTKADVKEVARGIGLDNRIGPRFLQAGAGYGGSCFPKDVKALISAGQEHGIEFKILKAVEEVNEEQKKSLLPKIKKLLPDLKGKTIAVWGLAFKPKTDDMREAPSIALINQLLAEKAKVKAFDPEAEENARKIFGVQESLEYFPTPSEALKDADCLVIVTEWHEFRNVDKQEIKRLLKQPNVVDGRNVYEPSEMKSSSFNYLGVGR